jgi:hypothetical protein
MLLKQLLWVGSIRVADTHPADAARLGPERADGFDRGIRFAYLNGWADEQKQRL